MIVRILGEGQFDVRSDAVETLNRLDAQLVKAVETEDHAAFGTVLKTLLDAVRAHGRPMAPDHLGASDLVVPGPSATIADVQRLLAGEGLSAP